MKKTLFTIISISSRLLSQQIQVDGSMKIIGEIDATLWI